MSVPVHFPRAARGRTPGMRAISRIVKPPLLSATYPGLARVTRAGRGDSPLAPSLLEGAEEVAIAMTIGASVALIVVGAILRFGVTWKPAHVDLQVIGVILMVAGVLGLVLSLLFMVLRRNDRRSAQVYEERRYTDPPA